AAAEPFDGLDDEAAAAIARADTFFVATAARTGEPTGGVDISHRGGPPGFVRVVGDTLTIPDYPGNRYFNTLGNLVSEPRAALVFVDFARGDLLHVQGPTEIDWHGPDVHTLDGAERLWRVHVERGWRRRSALPLRWH
ncbi:MAG TPA: pyridoxamine 5'-phosphate oxidase family protein, partial [Kofleriaceae bacterium]